eukprot:1148536-Pelagomonas_calceolata.AAC.1
MYSSQQQPQAQYGSRKCIVAPFLALIGWEVYSISNLLQASPVLLRTSSCCEEELPVNVVEEVVALPVKRLPSAHPLGFSYLRPVSTAGHHFAGRRNLQNPGGNSSLSLGVRSPLGACFVLQARWDGSNYSPYAPRYPAYGSAQQTPPYGSSSAYAGQPYGTSSLVKKQGDGTGFETRLAWQARAGFCKLASLTLQMKKLAYLSAHLTTCPTLHGDQRMHAILIACPACVITLGSPGPRIQQPCHSAEPAPKCAPPPQCWQARPCPSRP